MKKLTTRVSLLAALMFSSSAHATLIDQGNGLIFDSINNISWTQDANLSGMNNWNGQVTFANNLVLAGFDDFRLASITELASLYGQLPGDSGSDKTGNLTPFVDVHSVYWSGTEVNTLNANFFFFLNGLQNSGNKSNIVVLYGWAVRPGDSGRVAEPGSAVLMLAGLLGIVIAKAWWVR